MPTIAGVLLLVSAGFKLLGFFALLAASFFYIVPDSFPRISVVLLVFLLLPLAAILALAIAGSIASLQRRRWGLALTGAILSILPFSLLGIAATILVAISRDDFEKV